MNVYSFLFLYFIIIDCILLHSNDLKVMVEFMLYVTWFPTCIFMQLRIFRTKFFQDSKRFSQRIIRNVEAPTVVSKGFLYSHGTLT